MIQRLVVWGGCEGGLESHRWVQKAFHRTAQKLGISTCWVPDAPASQAELTPGTTVISADIWSKFLLPKKGVDYVLHNHDGGSPLCQALKPSQILRLQVWTTDAVGEEWGTPFRRYDARSRTLFQPWGTDLFAEEFLSPIYNASAREAIFVGAIWGEKSQQGELGNQSVIEELRLVLADHGLRFKQLTQVTEQEQVLAIRGARVAPALAGQWQTKHQYLPCRVFKNISYGALGLTNVKAFDVLLDGWSLKGETVADIVGAALSLRRQEYLDAVRFQQLRVARFSYRENLQAIARALEEGK